VRNFAFDERQDAEAITNRLKSRLREERLMGLFQVAETFRSID
jgi:hypothetical protein